MRNKYPDFDKDFRFKSTPDYSPRVLKEPVELSAQVREQGRRLVKRSSRFSDWKEMWLPFHTGSVFTSPASRQVADIEPILVDEADLVLVDDVEWAVLPPKASFPVTLIITKVSRGEIEAIEIDDADLVIFDF